MTLANLLRSQRTCYGVSVTSHLVLEVLQSLIHRVLIKNKSLQLRKIDIFDERSVIGSLRSEGSLSL